MPCGHNASSLTHRISSFHWCMQRLPRRLVNAPAKLIFPAGSKLLQAGNSRSYAMNALRPYLKKVHSFPGMSFVVLTFSGRRHRQWQPRLFMYRSMTQCLVGYCVLPYGLCRKDSQAGRSRQLLHMRTGGASGRLVLLHTGWALCPFSAGSSTSQHPLERLCGQQTLKEATSCSLLSCL